MFIPDPPDPFADDLHHINTYLTVDEKMELEVLLGAGAIHPRFQADGPGAGFNAPVRQAAARLGLDVAAWR